MKTPLLRQGVTTQAQAPAQKYQGDSIVTNVTAVIERLGALFTERFHIEVPSADTDLLETGILDSFQFVELLFQLEQHFGLRVPIDDIDLEDLRSLARIARLIADSGSGSGPPASQPTSGTAD